MQSSTQVARDYREYLIDQLEADKTTIATLTERVAVYKLMALEALARTHHQYQEQERQQAQLEGLRAELCRYTSTSTLGPAV